MARTALITGANRGIGLRFTETLLARGDRVIACCRQPGKAQALNALSALHPGRLRLLPLDVASEASRAELVRELPLVLGEARLDLLLNNAGVLHAGERFGQLAQATLEDSLRINAIGPLLLAQALAPLLADGPAELASGAASPAFPVIANLSSQLGSIAGVNRFGAPSYAISKAALNMVGAQLAQALAARRIVVLNFHPGWVQTDMGGPNATHAAGTVVPGMLAQIDAATPAQSGGFFDWQGRPLPW